MIQSDSILGLASRAGDVGGFTRCHVPLSYAQTPMFEAILGHGIIHNFLGRWNDPRGVCREQFFSVGWKLRQDGQINEALRQLYPLHPFSMDIVVIQFGDDGRFVPLRRMMDRARVYAVIREYVASRLHSIRDPDLVDE